MKRSLSSLVVLLFSSGLMAAETSDPALVAHYRFAEGSGDRLLDHSGHGHHGQIVNARWERTGGRWVSVHAPESGSFFGGNSQALSETLTPKNVPDPLSFQGRRDSSGERFREWALRFDGSGDYVDFGDNRALKMTGDFTMLAWITLDAPAYPDGSTNWTIFDCEAYPNEGTILRVDGAATTVMFRSSRAGTNFVQFGKARLANHDCYLVGVVRQAERARIIVDGVTDAEFACGGDPIYGGEPFKISSRSQSFAGLIHEVRLYRRALDAGEIAAEYWREAKRAGKDVSRQGKLLLQGSVYEDDPQVLAEVDFLGVLPLDAGERAVVALFHGDGTLVREHPVDTIPHACCGEFPFDMTGLPAGEYALSAMVRGPGDTARAAARYVFRWPASEAIKAPSPQTFTVPPLPVPRPRLQPEFKVLGGGGFHVAVGGRSFPVESRFSVPGGADLMLTARPGSNDHVAVDGSRVTLRCNHYRLDREIQAQSGRVLVRDTFANLTTQPVGVIFDHRLVVDRAAVRQACLAGYAVSPPVSRSLKTNPTAFAGLDAGGIGLVALDDVLIVQSQGSCAEDGLSLGSREFAVDSRASYTVEWAVYGNGSGDYYDLINEVRADEDRNRTTVQGTWVTPGQLMSKRTVDYVPPQFYFDVRRPGYFCIPCLSWSTDDPTVSLEGIEFIEYPRERAAVRRVIDAVAKSHPHLKTMFHIAPNLYATNKPDQLWPDSRLIGPDGKQTVYAYNYESATYFTKERLAENWRWWSYYPAVDNAYGQALLDSVEVMMDEMGVSGVFVDGALWSYGGGYSYDRFDGHSADIDPRTGTITRLKTAVPLLQQHAIAAWGRRIMDRGGVVVANNALPTRTFASQPFIFDREISEGPEVHLLPTPCTLGNPTAIQSETDVYDDILAKLSWGNLYFYYGEPLGLQHELPPARMYPITVTDVRSGCVTGRQRVVTMRDGIYGWPGQRCLHLIYRYDRRGRRIGHDFVTTIDAAGARTRVDLDDRQMAIVVKLPVTVECTRPVNAIVACLDEKLVEVSLHGSGPVQITGPDGRSRELQLNGEQTLTLPCPAPECR